MKIEAHGIRADLPSGWEGRISRRRDDGAMGVRRGTTMVERSVTAPVLHVANFALPEDRGDFGSGAVDLMGAGNVLLALVEYGRDAVGTALFAPVDRVPRLTSRMFSRQALQRVQKQQAGAQRFFTLNDRAFCLYAVIGESSDSTRLARTADSVASSFRVAAP